MFDAIADFLSREFFGNRLERYLLFFLIIVSFGGLSKVVYYILKTKVRKLADKSKTRLDEMIIDHIEEPISILIIVAGFFFAFKVLNLGGAEKFVVQVITIVFLVIGTWLIVRFVDVVVKGLLSPLVDKTESKLDDQVIPLISNLVKVAIWVMMIIVVLSELDYDVMSLITGLGLGGVAIAMAAKDTLGHMFGGFNIFMNKPFQIDDIVSFKGYEGTIEEVGLRMSTMRTWNDTLIFIPNSDIANSIVENLSVRRGRRVVLSVSIMGDNNAAAIDKVKAGIVKGVEATLGVRDGVRADFFDYGEYCLKLRVVFWVDGKDYYDIRHQCNIKIKEVLEETGVELSRPLPVQGQ